MIRYQDVVTWPSIQRDSEALRRRIAPMLRVRALRRQMALYLERAA